jgi:hypothetical protein
LTSAAGGCAGCAEQPVQQRTSIVPNHFAEPLCRTFVPNII